MDSEIRPSFTDPKPSTLVSVSKGTPAGSSTGFKSVPRKGKVPSAGGVSELNWIHMDVLYSSEIQTGRSQAERGADFATRTNPVRSFFLVLVVCMASDRVWSE